MLKRKLLFILVLLSALSSCDKFDKPETRPAFLKIDKIDLQTTSAQGSNSHKIVDAWVYIDDMLIGVYSLPAKVPVVNTGVHDVKIRAGIKRNGIAVDRKPYPFYKPIKFTQELLSDSVYELQPVVEYEDNIYMWVEDFEDPGFKLYPYQSDTSMTRVSSPASDLFEGSAGMIAMETENLVCEMRTNEPDFNAMPTNLSTPAYLEMNYRSNYPMEVGVLGKFSASEPYERVPLITLHSTNNQWNKTYLYLPDASNFLSGSPEFDIYFRVFNNTSSNGIKIYMDNLKVIFWN